MSQAPVPPTDRPPSQGYVGCCLGVAVLGIILMLVFAGLAVYWAVPSVREATIKAKSTSDLREITLGMHNYAAVHGRFPPAAICDKDGKPVLSWRVAILPYIGADELYKRFDLNEPWDGPHNGPLLLSMPKLYARMTVEPLTGDTMTYYRVFIGGGAAFDPPPAPGPRWPDDFPDGGNTNTMLVAIAGEPVEWTKPDEVAFDPTGPPPKLGFPFGKGHATLIGLADGTVKPLQEPIEDATLRALITRTGKDNAALNAQP